jgi:hypothetical protein
MPPALNGRNPRPSLFFAICSIVAGVIGFGIPVVGMAVACIGIWFGIKAIRQSRAADDKPGITCGIVGLSLCILSIVYWVCAILFESYR